MFSGTRGMSDRECLSWDTKLGKAGGKSRQRRKDSLFPTACHEASLRSVDARSPGEYSACFSSTLHGDVERCRTALSPNRSSPTLTGACCRGRVQLYNLALNFHCSLCILGSLLLLGYVLSRPYSLATLASPAEPTPVGILASGFCSRHG